MILMERGQIFSVDFIISIVVITAAIALLIQATEFNTYNMKEERIYDEMRNVARIAANIIVSSNETTCNDGAVGYLMNCVDSAGLGGGLNAVTNFLDESGYEYYIKTTNLAIELGGGEDYDGQDFVEVKRTTFVDNVLGNPEELVVRVWTA